MKFWRRQTSHDIVRNGVAAIFPRLWRYSLTLTGKPEGADDLAQATCLRAIEQADRFQADTDLAKWMFRIAHNLWVSELRKTAVRAGGGLVAIEDADLMDLKPGPEAAVLNREVMVAILRLPEAQRATVVLVYVEGYAYREAAEILDIPIGTVMSRLASARATISQIFEHEKGTRHGR
ncbi:RNA polymerase sigma factor [Tropicibacter sp. R16_0]|nr:RNA polymerase sigma factor [Tropicibacter sp. R16_0]MBO9450777.1 RNA polymerase sigma factor [Tropicibacter sp. R16_0]